MTHVRTSDLVSTKNLFHRLARILIMPSEAVLDAGKDDGVLQVSLLKFC